MPYNLTGLSTNSTSVLNFTQAVSNSLMFGWMFTVILVGLTIVIYTSFIFSTNDSKKSLIGTSFVCFLLAFLLAALNLVSDIVVYIYFILAAAIIAFTWKT